MNISFSSSHFSQINTYKFKVFAFGRQYAFNEKLKNQNSTKCPFFKKSIEKNSATEDCRFKMMPQYHPEFLMGTILSLL